QHLAGTAVWRHLQQFTSQTCSRDRKRSIAVALRFLHVVPPGTLDSLAQRVVHTARDPRRDAHDERTRWHARALGDDRTRCYDTAGADVHSVQQDAAHADQAVVFHRAAMQNRAVPHADARTDARREPAVHVDDRAIL